MSEVVDWVEKSVGFLPRKKKRRHLEPPKDKVNWDAHNLANNCSGTQVELCNKMSQRRPKVAIAKAYALSARSNPGGFSESVGSISVMTGAT